MKSNSFQKLPLYRVDLAGIIYWVIFSQADQGWRGFQILDSKFIQIGRGQTVKKPGGPLSISLARRYSRGKPVGDIYKRPKTKKTPITMVKNLKTTQRRRL